MKQFLKIDEEGYYIEPVILMPEIVNGDPVYDASEYLIEERYTEPLYKPKWTGTEWVEGITQEELDAMKPEHSEEPVTLEALHQKLEEQEGVNQMLAQQIVDLELQQLLGGV